MNIGSIVREAIRGIGYVNNDDVFHADRVFISNLLTRTERGYRSRRRR
jgi:S-adenosylmethionine synthetase